MDNREKEIQDRHAIINNIMDNVFVEAGAGAGKTTLIVERIVNQLKSGINPWEIVVITFTNAAAEELRGRIKKKVRQESRAVGTSDENLKNAMKYLDQMNISTIHSFCYKLLQDRIFVSGLPMDFRLMEETETQLQHEKFFLDWSGKLTENDLKDLTQYGEERKKVLWKIQQLFNSICELPDNIVIKYDENSSRETILSTIKGLVEDFEKVLCTAISELTGQNYTKLSDIPDDKLNVKGKSIKDELSRTNILYETVLQAIAKKPDTKKWYINVKKSEWVEGLAADGQDEKCRQWVEENEDKIDNLLKSLKAPKYNMYVKYAVKAREGYRNERTKNAISNDELIQRAHKLICGNEEVRNFFAEKYKCIYVDEFQDTDSLQEELIRKLALKPDGNGLRDGALFLVGDPKQSIYRFRGAQPEVYFRACEGMEALNGKVYKLNFNYRSNEKIISWVNEEFSKKKMCGDENYTYMSPIKKLPDEKNEKMLAGVYCWSKETDATNSEETDAKNLAELIYKLVNNEYYICNYDDNDKPLRRIKYSDFLVLCYKQSGMDLYLNEMQNKGIPVQLSGRITVYGNRALLSFARLFDFLTHPYDRTKRVGAIECLEKNNINHKDIIKWLINETKGMGAFGIAGYLCRNIELLLPHETGIDNNQILSVQRRVNQMVEKILGRAGKDDKDIAQQFWEYSEKVIDRELSLDHNADEVRFMNIHKAKGLEGNIVILAKRQDAMSFGNSPYRSENVYYPVYPVRGKKLEWSSYGNNTEILEKANNEDEAEKVRLEYVVATRAKEAFIVMDPIKEQTILDGYDFEKENTSIKDMISTDNSSVSDDTCVEKKEHIRICTDSMKADPKDANGKSQDSPIYKACRPSDFERASSIKAKASVESDGNAELKGDKELSKRPKGNIFGDAMHRSLELMINRCVSSNIENNIDFSILQALNERREVIKQEDMENYKKYLSEMLNHFYVWAEEQQLFKEDNTIYTELPFSYYEEGENKEPVWMNGAVDLVVVGQNGKITVYDYKSDRNGNLLEEEFEQSLKEKYEGQLKQYRHALSKLFKVQESDIDLRIVSFFGEDEIRIKIVSIS